MVNHENLIPESRYDNNSWSGPFEVEAQLEDSTAVLGFQVNTDKNTYKGVSYFNPSFRKPARVGTKSICSTMLEKRTSNWHINARVLSVMILKWSAD